MILRPFNPRVVGSSPTGPTMQCVRARTLADAVRRAGDSAIGDYEMVVRYWGEPWSGNNVRGVLIKRSGLEATPVRLPRVWIYAPDSADQAAVVRRLR
jgi:hypothetical protein